MIYYILFFFKFGKISQNLSSAAVVIGALRVKFLKTFKNTITVSNSLNPNQADLVANYFQIIDDSCLDPLSYFQQTIR